MTPKELEDKLQFLYDGMEMLEKESAIKDELIAVLQDSNAIMERYIKANVFDRVSQIFE